MCQQWDQKRTEIPQTHEGENTTLFNLLDSAKLVLRGKFIAMQTFKKKTKNKKQTLKQVNLPIKRIGKRKNNTTWTEEWNEDQKENKRSKKACSILRVKTDKNF